MLRLFSIATLAHTHTLSHALSPSHFLSVPSSDLVVLRYIPNDLTHVAGVITETPQTPLSHINLKAKQNNMPNAYIAQVRARACVCGVP